MENEKIDIEKIINHWVTTSDRDFETMTHLYEKGDFHWALFMGHLVIEKLLKASVVKTTQRHAPFTHDLRRLAKLSKLNFKEEYLLWLDTITIFNLNARYDNYKQSFYRKCTPDYTSVWISNIKNLREWIRVRL
ncbi:HEPN domain-containing protein [Mariniphaga sediminis]|jgi:HEPN domain-containing protein|uniref:HEPN domain-containing protein n=1 Tax=Mariniphaga sediminis TaxID=1628158 RepID=UPI00356413EE